METISCSKCGNIIYRNDSRELRGDQYICCQCLIEEDEALDAQWAEDKMEGEDDADD